MLSVMAMPVDEEKPMYGTVARMQIKPGMEAALEAQQLDFDRLKVRGFVSATVYRMDANPNEHYLAVVFESKEAYEANAKDPAQNARYERLRALLTADPEWHDGEIVHAAMG
jgi:quinol monooxygenase YgiN